MHFCTSGDDNLESSVHNSTTLPAQEGSCVYVFCLLPVFVSTWKYIFSQGRIHTPAKSPLLDLLFWMPSSRENSFQDHWSLLYWFLRCPSILWHCQSKALWMFIHISTERWGRRILKWEVCRHQRDNVVRKILFLISISTWIRDPAPVFNSQVCWVCNLCNGRAETVLLEMLG